MLRLSKSLHNKSARDDVGLVLEELLEGLIDESELNRLASQTSSERVALTQADMLQIAEVMCDYLETHGIWVEGVFRISPASVEMEALSRIILHRRDLILRSNDVLSRASIHAVAFSLKGVLPHAGGVLPSSFSNLKPEELPHFLEQLRHKNDVSYRLLHRLCLCLHALESSQHTKMDANALSVCMAQNLFVHDNMSSSSYSAVATATIANNSLVARLISEVGSLFPQKYERVTVTLQQAKGVAGRLTEEEWKEVQNSCAQVVTVTTGEVLIASGDSNTNLFRIGSGTYEIIDGNGIVVSEVGSGTLLGVLSVFDMSSKSVAGCRCKTSGFLYRITSDEISRMKESHPALASRFFCHIAIELSTLLLSAYRNRALRQSLKDSRSAHSTTDDSESMSESMDSLSSSSFGSIPQFDIKDMAPEHASSNNTMVRAKARGFWGSLIVSPDSVSHHASFLGIDRSFRITHEQLAGEHAVSVLGPKELQLLLKTGEKLKLSFSSSTDLESVQLALVAFLRKTSMDQVRLEGTTVRDYMNPLFFTVVTTNFENYAANCLSVRAGERVLIGQKNGNWYAATTVDRKPPQTGWLPAAILEATSGLNVTEKAMLSKISEGAVEVTLEPNELYIRKGDAKHSGHLMIVSTGDLVIKSDTFTGQIFQDGILGEVTYLMGGTPTADVYAGATGAIVSVLSPKVIKQFLDEGPTNGANFYAYLCLVLQKRVRAVLEATITQAVQKQKKGLK